MNAVESKNGSKEVFVKWKSPQVPNAVIITFQIEYKKIATADVSLFGFDKIRNYNIML